jgi:hypothetical protein
MKTLATIVLSLIAILASLVFILSSICAFGGDFTGHRSSSYSISAVVALSVVVGAMWANGGLNKKN